MPEILEFNFYFIKIKPRLLDKAGEAGGSSSQFFFLNIRESSYKNKTLFLDSACRITPQIHSLRDTNSSDQRKKLFLFFSLFSFLFTEYLSKKKEEFYFFFSLS